MKLYTNFTTGQAALDKSQWGKHSYSVEHTQTPTSIELSASPNLLACLPYIVEIGARFIHIQRTTQPSQRVCVHSFTALLYGRLYWEQQSKWDSFTVQLLPFKKKISKESHHQYLMLYDRLYAAWCSKIETSFVKRRFPAFSHWYGNAQPVSFHLLRHHNINSCIFKWWGRSGNDHIHFIWEDRMRTLPHPPPISINTGCLDTPVLSLSLFFPSSPLSCSACFSSLSVRHHQANSCNYPPSLSSCIHPSIHPSSHFPLPLPLIQPSSNMERGSQNS